MSDLRQIGFTITEALGNFITTPYVALKLGIRTSEEEVYICCVCKKVIDDRELMFHDFQKPFHGWQHAKDCR